MAAKKPRVVIIGAGMAGITAANRIHAASPEKFSVTVVEGGDRIGGRISTAELGGDRIEIGATWIHGIGGSPVHAIAAGIGALESDQPWECMDGSSEDPSRFVTVAEGGFEADRSIVDPVASLFRSLMAFAEKKPDSESNSQGRAKEIPEMAFESLRSEAESGELSVGAFLRRGLSLYWDLNGKEEEEVIFGGDWTRKRLEEGVFKVFENTQRTYTSAGDLERLDYSAESEYRMCSAEEITIARGYASVVEHLASALPPGMVKLGKRVEIIEWGIGNAGLGNGFDRAGFSSPVKLRLSDGTSIEADHVIVTVSLGVLKAGVAVGADSGLRFSPALPAFKADAIRRLGFGVVNKLFVKLEGDGGGEFPFLRMVFHNDGKKKKKKKNNVPRWMRKTAAMFPIYENSNVLLSWFAGDEALELESLSEEEIVDGLYETFAAFLGQKQEGEEEEEKVSQLACNGNAGKRGVRIEKVLRSQWGNDPLFLGSYSYVAVGSSGDDLDRMAEPLPISSSTTNSNSHPLQILFAGEATHRTHYSTTHGAYFSGLREANRLLKYYKCLGV